MSVKESNETVQVPGTAIIMTITAPKGKEKHPTVLGIELGVETEEGHEMIFDGWESDMVTMADNYLRKMYPNTKPGEDLWKHVKFYTRDCKPAPMLGKLKEGLGLKGDRIAPKHTKGEPLTIEIDKKKGHSPICVFPGVFRDYSLNSSWFSSDRANKDDHKVITFLFPQMPSSWCDELIARMYARGRMINRSRAA